MRKTFGLLAAATSIALMAGAPAAANNAAQKATVAPTSAKPERKICRPIEHTGSNRIEKLCLTAQDWKRVEKANAAAF